MESEVPVPEADYNSDVTDYLSQAKAPGRATDDADTCRICRAEGTDEEPLFYPCKCSGSIKFVHQECLMEWLSHSQKKHCELCKTPFRFTKLYHPQMPRSLPTSVFLRTATLHTIKAFVTCCRAMLVASVWLFWLPWSMRFIWWGLFWIGDGGWVYDAVPPANASNSSMASQQAQPGIYLGHNISIEATALRVPQKHSGLLAQIFQSTAMKSFPFVQAFLSSTSGGDTPRLALNHTLNTLNTLNTTNSSVPTQSQASLLSNISFFQKLTPNPAINKLITDVLEGQIIALSVVIAFILIFLIREWVVQQQPMINLGANGAEPNDVREVEQPVEPAPEDVEQHAGTPETEPTTTSPNENTPADQEDDETLMTEMLPWNLHVGESTNATDSHSTIGIDPPRGSALHSSNIMSTIHKTLQAVQTVSAEALENKDEELLAQLIEGVNSMKDRVLVRVPGDNKALVIETFDQVAYGIRTAQQLLAGQKELERSQQELVELLAGQKELERSQQELVELRQQYRSDTRELERSRQELVELRQQYHSDIQRTSSGPADSSGTTTSNNSIASSSTSVSRTRPNLPERSQSSMATEIRRTIEESGESSSGVLRFDSAAGDEDSGEGSGANGSLQQAQNFDSVQDTNQLSATDQSEHVESLVPSPRDHAEGSSDYPESPNSTNPIDCNVSTAPNSRAVDELEAHITALHDELTDEAEDSEITDHLELDAALRPNLLHRFWDWWWGEFVPATPVMNRDMDDEHIVLNLADEAPFIPFVDAHVDHRHEEHEGDDQARNDVLGIAPQAGLDPNDAEAIEDAEELDGIMELIGMQGALAGLVQNAVFCALLISATVVITVWLPYLWGKIVLVFLANPLHLALKAPWLLVSGFTNFAIDFCLFLGGVAAYWVDSIFRVAVKAISWLVPIVPSTSMHSTFGKTLGSVAESAFFRMGEHFLTPKDATVSDFYHLSLSSHAALYAIRANFATAFSQAWLLLRNIQGVVQLSLKSISTPETFYTLPQQLRQLWTEAPHQITRALVNLPDLFRGSGVTMSVFDSAASLPTNGDIAPWSTADRLIAIAAGYAFFATAGATYLKAGSPITNSPQGKRIEAMICDVLQQAGGVLKVILIISIEMLLFPLYCGFLLDVATLPLFEASTFQSRIDLTLRSPWTSGFVHWFIGTCYMFHFALFVSMCRKIVRSGVLYFIRDPDDPTFHPVRDVLERSISSQLRKIGFSALVYGALVSLCLGIVVWGVDVYPGVFPIRWSLDTQVLEFPIDLLLYNTLTPLVVYLLRPSRGLHTIYEWWFRRCARVLCLSQFLFGEQHDDEESGQGEDVDGGRTGPGRYVRAPGSDQVRIPKGRSVFVEVDADDNRLDGEPDEEQSEHGETNDRYTKVYLPPWFRLRIGLFIFCIWALTAAAGLGLTVAPLVVGRLFLSFFVQKNGKFNDIYTFSVGICILGLAYYLGSSYKTALVRLKEIGSTKTRTLSTLTLALMDFGVRALRVLYTYSALLILVPSLLAIVLEFYLIMPLHAYTTLHQTNPIADPTGVTILTSTTNATVISQTTATAASQNHTIHILQGWTLGLLYLRILLRLCLWDPASRPARALRAIVERGWLDPNVTLATRYFILPCTILALLATIVPAPLGFAAARLVAALDLELGLDDVNVLRFTYPAVLSMGLAVWMVWAVGRVAAKWKSRIRDEAYLIGERLHNFGEKKPPPLPSMGARLRHEKVD